MQRHGSVIVFKPGTTPEEAAKALEKIAEVLDLPEKGHDRVDAGMVDDHLPDGRVRKVRAVTCRERPFKFTDLVREYDDEYGGPVFYIP